MICQLYRHFDESGILLYVGISLNSIYRLSQHKASPWFTLIRRIEIENFPNREDALAEEARAIVLETPRYNRAMPVLFESLPVRPRRELQAADCPDCAAYRARRAASQKRFRGRQKEGKL